MIRSWISPGPEDSDIRAIKAGLLSVLHFIATDGEGVTTGPPALIKQRPSRQKSDFQIVD